MGRSPTGVDARQIFLTPTFAHRFGGRHTFRRGACRRLSGVQGFGPGRSFCGVLVGSEEPDQQRLVTVTSGWGYAPGILGQLTSWLAVGAAYRSLTKMQDFAKYSGLFAGHGGFNIPAAYNFGVAVQAGKRLTFSGDVQRTLYSSIPSVGHPMLPNLVTAMLGASGGAGFGWRDLTVVRFGAQGVVNQKWTLRAGVSESGQTIPASEVFCSIS